MYTSYIGKKFLQYYNEEYSKKYTAEEFFDEQMFPLFFDNEKYFMRVKNSPFDQLTTTGAKLKLYKTHEERIEANRKLKSKIYSKELAVHTFIGYGEMNTESSTSGQISNIDFNKGIEEFYSSWIGQGLAIKTGKFNILFDNKEVLLHIYRGWEHYRDVLNKIPALVKNQVNAWNTKWLLNNYRNNKIQLIPDGDLETKNSGVLITSTNWVELIFTLSKYFPNDILSFNSYEIGDKSNISLGFTTIYLKDINELYEFRDKYFINGNNSILSDTQIENLIPFYNFKSACTLGTIGLKSMEPKGLQEYIPKPKTDVKNPKDLDSKTYSIYKLWIIAMINDENTIKLSEELAKALLDHKKKNNRLTSIVKNDIEPIWNANNRQILIKSLSNLIEKDSDNREIYNNIVDAVMKDIPQDKLKLFLTLTNFKFNYNNS